MKVMIIKHEGPRDFKAYEIVDNKEIFVAAFKTNHMAMKTYGKFVKNSDSVEKVKKSRSSSDIPPMVEGCGRSAIKLWKRSKKSNSRKNAIRLFCIMCVGGGTTAATEVRNCSAEDCPLHEFRITG